MTGGVWKQIGDVTTPYGFTGELEEPNNLLYLRARYYHHDLGRFISLDPVAGTMNDPMSLNQYIYAKDNPVNWTDPSGTRVCSDLPLGSNERIACVGKVLDLHIDFGIQLTEEEALSPVTKDHWTSARVNNAYDAVQAVNRMLGSNPALTRQAIGNSQFRLVGRSEGAEAGRATRCDILSLFLEYTDRGFTYSDWVHRTDHIIHELGHMLLNSPPVGRTVGSEAYGDNMHNRPIALWQQIGSYLGIQAREGWNTGNRQSSVPDASEVVPDMFLYWVQGYGFNDDVQGRARAAFVNGDDILDENGNVLTRTGDNSPIRSAGVVGWAQNAACSYSASAPSSDTLLALYYPELQMANNGWCTPDTVPSGSLI